MHDVLKRTWTEIHLDNLEHNYRTIRATLQPHTRFMAVVKADAYGHGAVTVAKELDALGADCFAVSNLDELIQLRGAGIDKPILILSYTPPAEAAMLAEYRATQTVISLSYAKALSAAAVQAGVTLPIHIKVDTGMSRVGFVHHHDSERQQATDEIKQAVSLPALQAEGIFTHFATADEPDDTATRAQFTRFMQTVEDLKNSGITFAIRHCCNSAATERFPEMHLDMVRPGIILYGLAPSDAWMKDLLPLLPVMRLKTNISMIKHVPAGETVSYGATYTTAKDSKLATVPIGYADGYSRAMSNRAYMLLHGKQAPVVGRVCMDQCLIDVTDIPDATVGDNVTVFGGDLTVGEYAAWMNTIHYEAVCLIGKRVPRVYVRNGKQVGFENLTLK